MLGGLSAGGGTNFGIRAALFRSSTAKGITLSNATKAHPVVLFLFVSVCISLPLSAPRSFRFSPLLLVASPSSPYLTLSLAPSFSFYFSPSLALFPRVVFLSFFFLFLSISPFLSLSLSLAARRPPCCSRSAVNGPAKNPRGLQRIGESEQATRPTWGEGSKTTGPTRPKSEAGGPPAAERRVRGKS